MINELSKEDRRQPQAWKDIQSDQKLIHFLLLRLLRLTPFGQDQLFRQHRGHRRVRLQRFTVDMGQVCMLTGWIRLPTKQAVRLRRTLRRRKVVCWAGICPLNRMWCVCFGRIVSQENSDLANSAT